MTSRKRKGITSFIGGLIFVLAGIVLYTTTETPEWLPTLIQIIGAVGSIFGFKFVFPDTD